MDKYRITVAQTLPLQLDVRMIMPFVWHLIFKDVNTIDVGELLETEMEAAVAFTSESRGQIKVKVVFDSPDNESREYVFKPGEQQTWVVPLLGSAKVDILLDVAYSEKHRRIRMHVVPPPRGGVSRI